MSKSLRDLDIMLPHAKFAYNRSLSFATSHSPFDICYGLNPLTPLDFIFISQESKGSLEVEEWAKEIKKLPGK